MKPVEIHTEANLDMSEAANFYEVRAKGLGMTFALCVESQLQKSRQTRINIRVWGRIFGRQY